MSTAKIVRAGESPIMVNPPVIIRPAPPAPSWSHSINHHFHQYTLFSSSSAELLREKSLSLDLDPEDHILKKVAKLFGKLIAAIFLLPTALAGALFWSAEKIENCVFPKKPVDANERKAD